MSGSLGCGNRPGKDEVAGQCLTGNSLRSSLVKTGILASRFSSFGIVIVADPAADAAADGADAAPDEAAAEAADEAEEDGREDGADDGHGIAVLLAA